MRNVSYRLVTLISLTSIIAIFAILLLSKGYLTAQTNGEPESGQRIQNLDIASQKKYLSDQLKSLGPEKAYLKFKTENQNAPVNLQHSMAHIFGQLLYQNAGIGGVAICDPTFAFGCYHSFFTAAISDKGDSIIPSLYDTCIKIFGPLGTGCQHGLGHGVLEYLSPNKLDQALKICDSVQKLLLLGCSSGVFMEYNAPTLIDGDNAMVSIRQPDGNLFAPCDSIENKFKPSCYFEISQWWIVAVTSDYKEIGALCEKVVDPKDREFCFLGIGTTIVPKKDYNMNESIRECDYMPGQSQKLLCLSGVSWGFFIIPEQQANAPKICDSLDKRDQSLCMEKANLLVHTLDQN